MQNLQEIVKYLQFSNKQFVDRKALIDLSQQEVDLLKQVHLPLQQYETKLIDAFYQHLFKFNELKSILIKSGSLESLKRKQAMYFRRLTAGIYDVTYAENRLKVGIAHEQVGLNTQWYIGAYGAYLTLASQAISEILQQQPQIIPATLTALYKVALLDITLAFDAYMYASHQSLIAGKQKVSEQFNYQLRLQDAINRIQTAYITDSSDDSELFILLNEMLLLTESKAGLLALVKTSEQNQPYLKIKAISDSNLSLEQQKSHKDLGLEFHQLDNLLGEVLLTQDIVISNDLENDPRSGELYKNYLDTKSFLGLPIRINQQVSAVLVLVNRPEGYNDSIALGLKPITDALETLAIARKTKRELGKTLTDNARLAVVAKQTINGVVITDPDFVIQWCNPSYYQLTGYKAAEVIGKKPLLLQTGPKSNQEKIKQLMSAVKALKPIDIDIIKYKKDKTPYWARVSCNPTYANNGQHLGFVLVELDTTKVNQQNQLLQHYKTVLDNMNDAVYFVDVDSFNIIYANSGAQKQLGMTEQELLSLKPFNINANSNDASFKALVAPLVNKEIETLNYSTWHLTASDKKLPVEVTMQLVSTAFGADIIINLIRDISVQQQVERLHNAQERDVNNLLQRSDDPIAIINKSQRIIDCNAAALSLFGFTKQSDLINKKLSELGIANSLINTAAAQRSEKIDIAWQQGYQKYTWLYSTVKSTETPTEITLTPVIYKKHACLQVVWRDLTEIKEKERKIKQLAYFDELTGLANSNLFTARLEYLLKAAKQCNYTIAVIYFDIIKLAEINETMGYKGGDITIKAVAKRFAQQIRHADLALKFMDEDFRHHAEVNVNAVDREFDALARIHADKFALAAVLTNSGSAAKLTERIQNVIKKPLDIMGNQLTVSVRAGGALYPDDATDYDSLIRGANIARGHAKEQQLSHSFYNIVIGDRVQRRALIFQRLEHGIVSGQPNFSLRYQPQVNLKTGQLSGAEVLIRWFDNELGWVAPDVFIPLAEDRGLINPITAWVINTAGKQLADWQKLGHLSGPDKQVKLAINVSAKNLEMPNVAMWLDEKVEQLGLSAQDFEIELTETGLMRDPTQAIKVLHQLKQAGFNLAIDDFGTGHSSLSYLKNINADTLKIDMSFVRSLLTDKTNHAIVKTVIATAKIFGMKTLAEGVEDKLIADELTRLGCDYAQGYFYAKPLLAEEFQQNWLVKMNN
ncbi:EAL domain-containing protein [Rheinheimera sp. WS51]|uniref:EAL domain-containing protein n=1 Tax=Rheinheimera sp. WS51 TaxID=3425886 RepID=UPI003D8ED100